MRKIAAVVTLFLPTLLLITAMPALSQAQTPQPLAEAQRKVAAEFGRLDAALTQTAKILGTNGLTGDQARSALTKLCNDFDYAVDCAAVDLNGKMVTIEPAPFRQFEGKDISSQEQIQRIMKTGKPVLSNVFRAVEGFSAADAEYPVVTPEGGRLGSVSLLFHPEKLLGNILTPLLQGTPVDIWVIEKGGFLLFAADASEIGLNLFTSRLFKPYRSLINLGRRIAARPEGSGVYYYRSHTSPTMIRKNAFWQSVSLYGTEWRLVAIHAGQADTKQKRGNPR